MSEVVKRLQPEGETLRKLFLFSGNLCAFPDCERLMMNAKGDFIGQVCHIEAAMPGGERFNPGMTNEQRRQFENLMLMCYEHHIETNNTVEYTVERLVQLKSAHEKRFCSPDAAILRTIKDWTRGQETLKPENFHRLAKEVGWTSLSEEELDDSLREFNDFLDLFQKVPVQTRRFVGQIALRAHRMKDTNAVETCSRGTRLLASDAESALQIPLDSLKKELSSLEAYGLGGLRELGYENEAAVQLDSLKSGWEPWLDLADFCERTATSIDSLTVDLNFKQLDG